MPQLFSGGLRSFVSQVRAHDGALLVRSAAGLLIGAQLLFRAWALYPSWFYADDYVLLLDAEARRHPDPAYLLSSFNSHFMPVGRLLVWIVAHSGTTNWGLTATITLLLQFASSVACLWMLQTLFGVRWSNIPLLALYLTSAMAMPALMWWAAALNQLPLQLCFFCSVALWVRYLRDRRLRFLVLTGLSLLFGLLCDVRTMLIVPLLGYVMLMYFAQGRPRQRIVEVVRRYWPALTLGAVIVTGYTVYYVLAIPPPFESGSGGRFSKVGEIADSMLGTALTSGSLGGPWRWFDTTPPIVLAGPPSWTVHLSWVAIVLTIVYSVLRRARAARGWLLLAGYALGLYLLLVVSRGQIYGKLAGLEYRYLTDMVCVLPLCLGLVFTQLRGAVETSEPRPDPPLRRGLDHRWTIALVSVICIGGIVTSVRYVGFWHQENAGRSYVKNVQTGLRTAGGTVDLAEQVVPDTVMPPYTRPDNRTNTFVPLLVGNARFPDATDRLQVLDGDGTLHRALIQTGYKSTPGRIPGCGRRVASRPVVVPLDGTTFMWPWWMRIGYVSSADSPISVSAGDSVVPARVRKGLHSLFVRADGVFSSVRISGLTKGTVMCVDTIEVGNAVPGLGEQ